MSRDPALAMAIETPQIYRRRKLRLAVPLVVWLAVTLPVLLWADQAPDQVDRIPLIALIPALIALVLGGLGLLAMAIPLLVRSVRELGAIWAARGANARGMTALHSGLPGEAEEHFRAALCTPHASPPNQVAALHNIGVARLAGGDPVGALALMVAAEERGWYPTMHFRETRAAYSQGRCVASTALGDLDAAHDALAQARAHQRKRWAPMIDLAAVLLHVRAGEHALAEALAASLNMPALAPPAQALVTLARAMALSATGASDTTVARLVVAHPLAPDEPAWARQHWPELAAFATRMANGRPSDPDSSPPATTAG